MSLSVTIRVPGGICLVTDSRLTIAEPNAGGMPKLCFLDAASKVWLLGAPNTKVAVSFYGTALTGVRTVGDLVAEWGENQGEPKPVEAIAHELHSLLSRASLSGVVLDIAGYDGTAFFGRVFEVAVPGGVKELFPAGVKGVSLGGQKALAERVLEQLRPPLDLMPLLSAAELGRWLVELTAKSQDYTLGLPSVGGKAQTALLERGKAARLA